MVRLGKSTLTGTVHDVSNKQMIDIDASLKDDAFKSLMKFKYIAGRLLNLAVDDFREYDLDTIILGIEDVGQSDRKDKSLMDIYTSEIQQLNLESGSIGEKQIRHDLLFKLKLPKDPSKKFSDISEEETETSLIKFSIDIEMQKSSSVDYSLVSRGIYYAASILRDTLDANNRNYKNIHKVYSL